MNEVIKYRGTENAPKSVLEEINSEEITLNSIQKSIDDNKKKIEVIKRTQIDEVVYKRAYEKLTQSIDKAPIEYQRDLFSTFFEKITSHIKAGDENGHISIKLYADGEIIEKGLILAKN